MTDAVLFYCQHLLGIGHLSRSLAVSRALARRFHVVFAQGGPDIGRTLDQPGFTHEFLPPILMREHDSSLYDPAGERDLDALWAARQAALDRILDRPFAAVIVELFPFGRNKFKSEILWLIAEARRRNPGVRIYCSNRDIMVQKADQARREDKIVRILKEHFDCVLVHSDPQLIPMEATFGATARIREQIRYTGYVAEHAEATAAPRVRAQRILASVGGGAVGEELAIACASVARSFPDHEMRVLTGPYTPDAARATLEAMAREVDTLSVQGFSPAFRDELSRAALSISLAGYNTLMDILATGTPALVYPYMANREQEMRAAALARLGRVGLIYRDDLSPARLVAAIRERLAAKVSEAPVDLSGAETTARIIADDIAG